MNLDKLYKIILDRKKRMPKDSYTTSLLEKSADRVLQKVGEEAVELVIASKNQDRKEIISESADMLYHFLVLLVKLDIDPKEITEELDKRMAGNHKIKNDKLKDK